ncbi:MAG: mechanosensitive ion channel domain-containing protein [Nitrospirota bacterium]
MTQREWLALVVSWPFAAELALAILGGAVAWLIYRRILRLPAVQAAPDAPITPATLGLRFVSLLLFPLAWVCLLMGGYALLGRVVAPTGLIETIIPLLWFFMLYQAAAASITLFLPKRHGMRFLVWLAVAVGVVTLAARYLGYGDALSAAANFPLVHLGPAVISVAIILKAVFLFGAIFLVAGQLTALLQSRFISRTDIDPNLSSAMLRFLKFFLFGIGVLIVLDTAGINLSALTIFGGALGIGLGFGLQTIANNLVSGVIFLLDRSIKQGDVITVGDSYGWVVKLGARYVVVRTRDGVEKLIPNANLITTEITNWSHSDRAVRLHVKVGVSYQSDPFKVRDLLLKVADTHPRVLKYPQPNVLFVNFGESSMDFELRLWINDPQEGVENVRSAMRFEIWKTFKEHGIDIPFPQRDLHIKTGPPPQPPRELRPSEFEESLPPAGPAER